MNRREIEDAAAARATLVAARLPRAEAERLPAGSRRALELAARDVTDPQMLDKLQQHADGLDQQVQAALRARGMR